NNMTSAVYMGIYSFSGLISGAFNKINKYFCILGYILSWTIIYPQVMMMMILSQPLHPLFLYK
ncbi:hypothetical protein D1N53_24415, partial [Clostridioides difficile]